IPEHDHRQPQLRERRDRLLAKAPGDEAVCPRRAYYVGRGAAVARDAARDPQLFERHDAAVVLENHRERRRPALDGLHLQHRRRAVAPRDGRLAHDPKTRCSAGTTMVMGRRSATMTLAVHGTPDGIAVSGPADDDQRTPLGLPDAGVRRTRTAIIAPRASSRSASLSSPSAARIASRDAMAVPTDVTEP